MANTRKQKKIFFDFAGLSQSTLIMRPVKGRNIDSFDKTIRDLVPKV